MTFSHFQTYRSENENKVILCKASFSTFIRHVLCCEALWHHIHIANVSLFLSHSPLMASLDQLFRSALMMACRRAVVGGIVFILIVPSSAILDELAKVEITDADSFPIDRSKRSLLSQSPASVNIIQQILFNQTQMNKYRGNIKEQLKQIADQLIRPSQVLITSFERGILQEPLHKINSSLTSFGRYLNDPDNQTLSNNFFQDATALPATLQALLDILGRADIVPTLIDALKVSLPIYLSLIAI